MRATSLSSRRLSAAHGVTAPQLLCLTTVAEDGPLSVSALSQRVHLSPSTVVGIVDRLEAKALLTRARSTVDRRRVDLNATDEGWRVVAQAPALLQDRLASGLRRLPELQQVSITLALEEVVQLLEISALDAAPILEVGPIQADERGGGAGTQPAALPGALPGIARQDLRPPLN